MYCAEAFRPAEFLLNNLTILWGESPYLLFVAFPLLILVFSLFLIFVSLINTHLGFSSLDLSSVGLCASGSYVTISFPILGNFQFLSLQIFSQALSFLSETPVM